MILDDFGRFWTVLDYFGRFWVKEAPVIFRNVFGRRKPRVQGPVLSLHASTLTHHSAGVLVRQIAHRVVVVFLFNNK